MPARVLVVDDIFPNVKLLETKLSAEYFDVVVAMNGPDGLAICEQSLCDIVLLDVMMPGMDGFEVCRRIKNSPTTGPSSGRDGDRPRPAERPPERARRGRRRFLTKPVDDVALMARVRSLVRLKSMTDEMRTRALARASSASATRSPRPSPKPARTPVFCSSTTGRAPTNGSPRARAVPPGRGRARSPPRPGQGRRRRVRACSREPRPSGL
jgi:PleD family two-component response regulator